MLILIWFIYRDRSGLKFKCGRTVLYSDKTFQELGVETNSEIVVTGGRGWGELIIKNW